MSKYGYVKFEDVEITATFELDENVLLEAAIDNLDADTILSALFHDTPPGEIYSILLEGADICDIIDWALKPGNSDVTLDQLAEYVITCLRKRGV